MHTQDENIFFEPEYSIPQDVVYVANTNTDMEISSLQSVRFFGLWDQPRRVLVWEDITAKCYSWRKLRDEIMLSAEELRRIQPSAEEWVNRGALQMRDLPDMTCFPVNPFLHLHADLAEVWSMGWTAETLKSLGVTYDQLRSKGMNVEVMKHFGFTMSQWLNMGMRDSHVSNMTDEECHYVLSLPRDEVLDIISNYQL